MERCEILCLQSRETRGLVEMLLRMGDGRLHVVVPAVSMGHFILETGQVCRACFALFV